jgi:phage-related protein
MFKYLKLLGSFRDVTKVYEEEKSGPKPWYVSRRLFGTVFMFIGLVLQIIFDTVITPEVLEGLADNTVIILEAIQKIIPAVTAIYGASVTTIGTIKRNKR